MVKRLPNDLRRWRGGRAKDQVRGLVVEASVRMPLRAEGINRV